TNAITGPITVATQAGTNTSDQVFTVISRAPTIASFSPTTATAGTAIDIRGSNLTNIQSVKFNGADASFTPFAVDRVFPTVPSGASTGPTPITTKFGSVSTSQPFVLMDSNPPEPPQLNLRALAGSQLEISWPSQASNFVLQAAVDISSSA